MSVSAPAVGRLPLVGNRVRLEPIADTSVDSLARIDDQRRYHPRTGGDFLRRPTPGALAPPLLVVDARRGEPFGVIDNLPMDGAPDVLELTMFLDETRHRPGYGLEAYLLYVGHLFSLGAHAVRLTVLEHDHVVRRILTKLGFEAQARLRQHEWAGGMFHDLLVFTLVKDDRTEEAQARLRSVLRWPSSHPPGDSSS